MAAGKTGQYYEDPCETLEVSELCCVYGRPSLACTARLRASVEKWAEEKYCFCKGAKRKAQSRQMRKWLAYLPQPYTQICSKEEAHWQSPYLSLLSIPFMTGSKCSGSPREHVCEHVCASLSVKERHTSLLSIHWLI